MQAGSTPQTEDKFQGIALPDVNDMQLQLEQLVEQGVLTPEQAQAQLADRSETDNISTDPRTKEAQMAALSGLQDIANSGGMTDSDEVNLNHIRNDEDTAARGKREAILQNAASRGLGGSGLELMSQMQNQQDAATRTSARDMDVSAQAKDRALQALMDAGKMGGDIQAQDFSQQATKANANDAIAKFNAQNQQQVGLTNTAANNAAQAANLANKQSVANANVGQRNSQQQYNKELLQKNFQNQIQKAGGQTQVAEHNSTAAGANSAAQANANNQTLATGVAAVSPVVGAYMSAKSKDQNAGMSDGGIVTGPDTGGDTEPRMLQPGEFVVRKKDVPEMLVKMHTNDKGKFDPAAFLDSITGHKHSYKKKSI